MSETLARQSQRLDAVAKILSGILSLGSASVEVLHAGGGRIHFYTESREGVRIINRLLKGRRDLRLVETRTCSPAPDAPAPGYLIITEPI